MAEAGLSPKSIKNLTITLALIRKHAGLEPFAKGLLCLPKQTEAEVEPPCFSPSEMAAIIAEAKGKYRVVFATAAGTGMRVGELFGLRNVVKRVLHPILRKLGIERCGMHAFRHGRVSFLVEHSVPVELIRQWIGHGSEKMIRRYTHLRPEYHRAVLDKLPIVVPIVPRPEEVTC